MLLLVVFLLVKGCVSIVPTAEITVKSDSSVVSKLYASEASFGTYAPMSDKSMTYSAYVTSNLFCDENDIPSVVSDKIYVVPRGKCSFEKKASLVQKVGGVGMVVYGTLSSRYDVNSTSVVYPIEKQDYDCNYGKAYVPSAEIVLPYESKNDNTLESYGKKLSMCKSKKVLLTGNRDASGNYETCCAWDLHVWLYSDPNITESITIPSLYITMKQFDDMSTYLGGSSSIVMQLNQRYRADYNISAILIWVLGIFVAVLASYLSASEYYKAAPQPQHRRVSSRENMIPLEEAPPRNNNNEENLELTLVHAFVFILFASCSLFILFFFQIYKVVKVMYAFGCSGAVTQVIFYPLMKKLNKHISCDMYTPCCTVNALDIGTVSYIDIISALCGYTLGFTWLLVGFLISHPEHNLFYWITQDVMGACICITFLSVIRVNSLKVATVLLSVAFFYDIFFVFITPYFFKESIMVTVATSGGPPTADPTWCEKYPDDKNCQGGDPLPMLFTIPRIGDFLGGSSLLGLGDIVLPGLLLSFCRRVDAAKYYIGLRYDDDRVRRNDFCNDSSYSKSGYWVPCCVAYAIGLIMANMAVYIFQSGQPALLYLVPMCCGTVATLAKCRGEYDDMWNGPKVLRAADAMLNGEGFIETASTDTN